MYKKKIISIKIIIIILSKSCVQTSISSSRKKDTVGLI